MSIPDGGIRSARTSAFTPVHPPKIEDLAQILDQDFVNVHISQKPESELVPYAQVFDNFTETEKANIYFFITTLISYLSIENPSASTPFELIAKQNMIIETGKQLKGFSVLKILEIIVTNEDLRQKIKIIFKYPDSSKDINPILHPVNFILAKIKEFFFGGLQKYLTENQQETELHLKDFAIAIGKQADFKLFKKTFQIAKWHPQGWHYFFTLIIFQENEKD